MTNAKVTPVVNRLSIGTLYLRAATHRSKDVASMLLTKSAQAKRMLRAESIQDGGGVNPTVALQANAAQDESLTIL
jgi:hypothetical protein